MKYLISYCWLVFSLCGCQEKNGNISKISGEAQGTTYSISWLSGGKINYKASIDSIFRKIDSSLSTYLPVSIISRINNNDSAAIPDEHFENVFKRSMEVSEITGGAFDVTVGPLVNAWGFGFSKKDKIDSNTIRGLLPFTGYRMVRLENGRLFKEKKEIMVDFNAIAQGYTIDVIAAFLESNGIRDYFIELGGEVRTKGKKEKDQPWKIGIDKPNGNKQGERVLQAIIELENRSLATSGNYRKFYEENGQKYSHIIDPATGYPAKNNLLSASVIAADCMTADAFATAFMVMGLEKSKTFLSQHPESGLEVYFIYDEKGEWKTFISENLKGKIREL